MHLRNVMLRLTGATADAATASRPGDVAVPPGETEDDRSAVGDCGGERRCTADTADSMRREAALSEVQQRPIVATAACTSAAPSGMLRHSLWHMLNAALVKGRNSVRVSHAQHRCRLRYVLCRNNDSLVNIRGSAADTKQRVGLQYCLKTRYYSSSELQPLIVPSAEPSAAHGAKYPVENESLGMMEGAEEWARGRRIKGAGGIGGWSLRSRT
jgi:hypothetical protein